MTPEEGRNRDRIKREILNRPLLKLHLEEQREAHARDTYNPGDGFRAGFLLLGKLWHKCATIIRHTWRGWLAPVQWGPYHLWPDGWFRFQRPEKPMTFRRKLIEWVWLPFWYGLPFEFWGMDGWLWEVPDARYLFTKESGHIRGPFGGMIESIFRRRRRCCMCGKYFWRLGAFNPFYAVNIFEEHCSGTCSEDELSMLPY